MLQTRAGKRTGPAAVRIAVEMVEEGLIKPEEALLRVDPEQLNQLLHPVLDEKQSVTVLARDFRPRPEPPSGAWSLPPMTR